MRFTRYISLFFLGIMFLPGCTQKISRIESIGIVPLGKVGMEDLRLVQDSLRSAYPVEVRILDPLPLPGFAFTNVRSPRYRADSILKYLANKYPGQDKIIAITNQDISITKYRYKYGVKVGIKEPAWKYRDYGIFGLGQRPGRVCVVSVYRLRKGVNRNGFNRRLGRIAIHEIGHTLGLKHCPDTTCIMTDAMESIRFIDSGKGELCANCTRKLNPD